ncbi:MAG: hypothetical protein DRG78_20700 [Epsilonproteobacteria bacterium]|nr:MAG: hypothetical protein DRG78_20700 [Campylobacterota bacterium]
MSRYVGISDKIAMGKETTFGTETSSYDVKLGIPQTFKWTSTASTKKIACLGNGVKYYKVVDGVESISGSVEYYLTHGKELEFIFGDYSDDGSNFTLDVSTPLPSYSIKAQYDNSNYVKILGVKFTKATLTFTKDDIVKVTADWLAQSISEVSGTNTDDATDSNDEITFLDGYIKIGTDVVAAVNSATLTIDWKSEALRGIEQVSAGDRRKITEIVEKNLDISGDLEADITSSIDLFQKYFGGTSIQDNRSTATITFNLARGSHTFTITLSDVTFTDINKESKAELEPRTVSLSFTALDIDATGTL